MAQSTTAGVITACGVIGLLMTGIAALITAMATRRTSMRVEAKVDRGNGQLHEVHVLVDGQNSRLQAIVIGQQQQIIALEEAMSKRGLTIPITPNTTGEPIVATAVIKDEAAGESP